jgi:dynein assembly factor 1
MTLNLEKNEIEHVENLQNLRFLQNLDLSYNHLRTASSIEHLSLCESLSTVDLRHNYIDFDENLLPIFEKIPTLKVLYLKNNPLVRDFANYRKQLVGKLKELTYLDDRPVNLEEKRLCFAWVLNGALGFQ